MPIRTATSTPIPTETPTQAVTADAETGSATTSEPPTGREREETTYPPTTSRPPNDGLGRGLALAAILFLSGLGLVAGATGGLALAYSRFRTDQFETWESVLFALVLVGGLFAAVRGFTFDPSGGDTYSLAVFTSLGSAFLLVAWLLSRPVLWLLRDDETTDGAGKERLGPGVVVAGLAVLVVVGIVSLLVSVVTALVVIVIVGVIVAFYVHGD